MKVSGSWLQAFTERDVKVVSYSCKIWVAKVQMVKAHLCFEKYDLRQLLTRIIEEVQSDFRTRRTVSSFSLGPASIGLPVTFVILKNHFSSYPLALKLHDICIWGSATVTVSYIYYTCTMWRETKRRLHGHFADGYAKQRYVENLLYSALGGPSVCALCVRWQVFQERIVMQKKKRVQGTQTI